uniref:SET domain-containing protein n=1 Tax=Tetradesmus obliquus TaxID=3088 RepID=A0A383WD32_TETOB|eukprot:jgi/Sobl393_1/15275/SZX75143.1
MSAVEVRALPGRGRGLVTTRQVEAGEAVLVEEPLLLTVSQEAKDNACAHCLCWLERCTGAVRCQACHQAAFCSPQCQQQAAAKPWVHADATCRAYAQLPLLLPGDAEGQASLRFLIQAAGLKHSSGAANSSSAASSCSVGGHEQLSGYAALMALVGEPSPAVMAQAAVLQPALCQALGDASCSVLSVQEAASLLAKEAANSFGLLAPLGQQGSGDGTAAGGDAGARVLRGGALYPTCALLNHECLPNVARFDALDAAVDGRWPAQWPGQPAAHGSSSSSAGHASSTAVVMRALHALPPGSEVTLSYFPLHWELRERQAQAQQVYGFTCGCPRCQLEASPEWQQQADDDEDDGSGWETDDGGEDSEAAAGDAADAAGSSSDHDMEESEHQQQLQLQQLRAAIRAAAVTAAAAAAAASGTPLQPPEPLDASYLSLFMLKYVCPVQGCFGTMAALRGSNACECSVCGALRSEAEFLAGLEQQG